MGRTRFGVGFRLIGGLCAITLLTITTGILAIFGFNRMQEGFEQIGVLEVPNLITAAKFSRQSESIVANAPALILAKSQQERETVALRIDDQVSYLETLAGGMAKADLDDAEWNELRRLKGQLVENLNGVNALIEARLQDEVESAERIENILQLDDRLLLMTSGVMGDTEAFQNEFVDKGTKSNFVGIEGIVRLWALKAKQVVSLMLASQGVRQPESLEQLRRIASDEFKHAEALIGTLPPVVITPLTPVHEEIRLFAVGDANVFDARAKRIQLEQAVQNASSHNQLISDEFVAITATVFDKIQENVRNRSDDYKNLISRSSGLIIMISALSVIAAATLFLYVYGNVVRRLKRLQQGMKEHVAERSVDIDSSGEDEIADMARSLEFFVHALAHRERALKESEQRLIDAIESISEGFSLYDADDRLLLCNSKYSEVLYPGTSIDTKLGSKFEAIARYAAEGGWIRDAECGIEKWIADRLVKHRNPKGPELMERRDGRWIQFSERKTEEGGTVAVYTDITDLKQAELTAAEANRAKSDFLRAVGHEANNLLNPIISYMGLVERYAGGQLSKKQSDNLKKSLACTKELQLVIDTVRHYLKQDPPEPKSVHPEHLLDECLSFVMLQLRRGVELRKEVEPGLPALFVDPFMLKRIVSNLLSNAVKCTTKGMIVVSARRLNDKVAISVRDTGWGIPENALESIFDKDVQLRPEEGGSGLGLTICKDFAERIGGMILVESTLDEGSTFTVTIPLYFSGP